MTRHSLSLAVTWNLAKQMSKRSQEKRNFNIEFHWVSLEERNNIEVYPRNVVELMNHLDDGVQHFIYRE